MFRIESVWNYMLHQDNLYISYTMHLFTLMKPGLAERYVYQNIIMRGFFAVGHLVVGQFAVRKKC